MPVSSIRTERLDLVPFDPIAIRRLIEGDRWAAEGALVRLLPDEFPHRDEIEGCLPIQLHRMEQSPKRRAWMARLMVAKTEGVVGHCGFHGPPEIIGRAEIGYTVFTPYRGKGFAREAAAGLVRWAFEQGEKTVFATVSPANPPSLPIVPALAFQQIAPPEDQSYGPHPLFTLEQP